MAIMSTKTENGHLLQDVGRELVKYLFAAIPNACCERFVIKGQVRRRESDGEWLVFVDGEQG